MEDKTMMENRKKKTWIILVLSDSKEMYLKVKHLLRKKDYYRINHLSSFDKAYRQVLDSRVDFVFYDVHLALKDGVRKLDMIKKANNRVPVVVSAVLKHPKVNSKVNMAS